jgi:hypothetical protein
MMRELPWLIYSSDADRLRRNEERRTLDASTDLLHFAEAVRPHGLHLLIEDAVDIAFDLRPWHLPPNAVDARGEDALGMALDDVDAVLITAGGIFIGKPITTDRRWFELVGRNRTRGELGSSALSGAYLGLSVAGPHTAFYRAGA